MSDERMYPREWYEVFNGDTLSRRTIVSETAFCLFDETGRKRKKESRYSKWYPTLAEAATAIEQYKKDEQDRDAARRLRDAAPKLLEACKAALPKLSEADDYARNLIESAIAEAEGARP